MKKSVLSILVTFLFLSLPVQSKTADVAHPELNRIKAEELKQLMDKKTDFILVDARDGGKYSSGHIKDAVNIYFDSSGDPMVRKMSLTALPMDKLIIVYCDWEDEKSAAGLAMDLYDMGFDTDMLKILSGGITQWKNLGYPLLTVGE